LRCTNPTASKVSVRVADLVDLDQDAVGAAPGDPLGQSRRGGIAHQWSGICPAGGSTGSVGAYLGDFEKKN
jgi:hypothetical protein